ncbi:MAG: HAMP domain-containing protein [Rhodospirillaceae bacterium]|nr:HAMP domain-containing protein [Rhodospirillaceae bacterium]
MPLPREAGPQMTPRLQMPVGRDPWIAEAIVKVWQKLFPPQPLERVMPATLMARASLTILIPLVLVQVISAYVFYDNHLSAVTERIEDDLAGDLALVSASFTDLQDPLQRERMILNARKAMGFDISFLPGATLKDERAVHSEKQADDSLKRAVWQVVGRGFVIDRMKYRLERLVLVQIQQDDGVLNIMVPRQRILAGGNSTLVFVMWLTGSSVLLFGVATVYLRSQVASVRRLARAAEAFGKGREVQNFPEEGALEVRQAARAFTIMRERIQRQIAQRTEMLAGVSHDLRTPLTRMKLQLAMMTGANSDDVTAMRDDVTEMEKMLESYLAFARGDGAEAAVGANPAELLADVVGRFRREGAEVALHLGNLPARMALKPIALGRCLGNLIANAVRYGRKVQVSAAHVAGFIHIDVDDDGPGIPADKREEAFRAFHRLEPSRNTRTGGIGLGLTIARDLVHSMGGDIALATSPMGGLRATLRIPL